MSNQKQLTPFQKQVIFTSNVPKLLNKAYELGYLVTLGDAYRDPRVHGAYGVKASYSAASSDHKLRLAIDLNLFTPEGKYLANTEDHKKLGEWWESIGGTWGGRYPTPDGNHYGWGAGLQ